jgi:hypothetical protein
MDDEQPAVPSSVPEPESKNAARLVQLSNARESAVNKKRQRDADLSYIKTKIASIDEKINAVEPAPDIAKRQKIITKQEDPPEPSAESWSTALIRTSAVLTLGAASWYFQHMYGKQIIPVSELKKKAEITTPTIQATKPPLLFSNIQTITNVIGKSGFMS